MIVLILSSCYLREGFMSTNIIHTFLIEIRGKRNFPTLRLFKISQVSIFDDVTLNF